MAEYPRTINELYPEDTRWGEGIVPAPLWGEVTPAFEADLDQSRAWIRDTIRFFEDKYPDFHWWERAFVEARPAVSLLMQSVNPKLAFQCMADITQLSQEVARQAPEDIGADYIDVGTARLALNALAIVSDGQEQLDEARSYMTEEDQEALWRLAYGIGGSALGAEE